MNNRLVILLTLLSLSACSTTPPPETTRMQIEIQRQSIQSPEEKQLHAAEAKWSQKKPTRYVYTLQRTCFCPKEYNRPIEVSVSNGIVQRAMLPQDNEPLPSVRMDEALTIKDLFDIIHKAIDKKAAKIDVKYDSLYGYPASIAIDWEKRLADEETYLTAKYLRPL